MGRAVDGFGNGASEVGCKYDGVGGLRWGWGCGLSGRRGDGGGWDVRSDLEGVPERGRASDEGSGSGGGVLWGGGVGGLRWGRGFGFGAVGME